MELSAAPPPATESQVQVQAPASIAQPPAQTTTPDFMSLVESLSREDIEDMLNDDKYYDAYFGTLEPTEKLYETHNARLKRNISLADENNALRPSLEQLRIETLQAFEEARQYQNRWISAEKEQDDLYKKSDIKSQLKRLRSATTESDHLSESLAKTFHNGDMSEDDFVKQFLPIRKTYHRRALQVHKAADGAGLNN